MRRFSVGSQIKRKSDRGPAGRGERRYFHAVCFALPVSTVEMKPPSPALPAIPPSAAARPLPQLPPRAAYVASGTRGLHTSSRSLKQGGMSTRVVSEIEQERGRL
ncbi:Hypothetical protein NTJ_02500 [Nesidiocoris tenuis]|uniref:Uncharacterized protein n=1 Tax=Nesidiocoris tenuis TaxID=355587 RepID=A0ABN7AH71_9HEMI|nr:Hypothetical protein NTJ_02500 [Nesidiocoris tenuis]